MAKQRFKYDVISVGSVVRDVVFYSDQCSIVKNPDRDPTKEKLICFEFGAKIRSKDVHFGFGGGAANTSINFAGLGLKSGVLAGVGDDVDGRAIRERLTSRNVKTSLLQISKKDRTGLSFLVVDKPSSEHTAYVYYGASHDLQVSKAALARNATRWYYLSSLPATKWKELMKNITGTGSKIAWNPGGKQLSVGYKGLRPFLKQTSVLIVNKDEATELSLSHPKCEKAGSIKEMLKRIHSWGPEIVLITNSQEGSWVYNGVEFTHQPSPHDKPVDTTGAGDCFGSSFTTGVIRYQGDIPRALKLAQKNATALVHSIGAQNGLLKWKQLPKSLQQL